MEEQTIPLNDPEETISSVTPQEIDADWTSVSDDRLGVESQEDNDAVDEEQGNGSGEDADEGDAAGITDSGGSDQSFTLKHLGAVSTVGRDEVITLAQKGLDYDRIRGKYDEVVAGMSKTDDAYALLKELAEVQGVTAEELIDATRAQLLVQTHGLEPAVATERVMSMRTARERQNARNGSPAYAATAKRQAEISEFLGEYGTGIDPMTIPPEVWQSVSKGKTLLAAYQSWELQKLRVESKAAQKSRENKERSAGSRFSAGSVKSRDAIADDWYDG